MNNYYGTHEDYEHDYEELVTCQVCGNAWYEHEMWLCSLCGQEMCKHCLDNHYGEVCVDPLDEEYNDEEENVW